MSFSKYSLFFICLALHGNEQHYSENGLTTLLAIEYQALQKQENLLAQPQSNAEVKKSIEQIIARIKQQITVLEQQKKELDKDKA